ncbi:hypothetical protein LDC_1287 [sediment metagenome]|uniref:Uncharacterized protein n=1 Tax=sediment metagenome TaxID=749907 RepID=D9PID1_9ZZZZ
MSVYTVPFDNLSVTNDSDQDIFQITAPADAAVKLVGFEFYSATTTDERVRLRLVRRSTAGSGGAGAVEVPATGTSAAVGTAVVQLNTTPGTIGDILLAWYWSQLSPLTYAPIPEGMIVIPPSGILALNLETAVASTRNWSGWLKFAELG